MSFFAFITLFIGVIEQCNFKKISFNYVKNRTLNAKNGILFKDINNYFTYL